MPTVDIYESVSMGRIAVLDDNMINMIAAGEVIERPASVVKELLENSIDAGATKITVEIEQGGRQLIRIVDDGCGMDADDLALAFEPHATSKLRTSEDLAGIRTMGFRGEALASIGSVAKVAVTSRTADEIGGHVIEIDCGQRSGFEAVQRRRRDNHRSSQPVLQTACSAEVFADTPSTEFTHIKEHFTRIALSHDSSGPDTPAQRQGRVSAA